MRVYNSIPVDIESLVGAEKLHYDDAFDSDFYLLFREMIVIFIYCLGR